MDPIILKAADVIQAAREAYLAGDLSAQGPTPACRYRDASGHPCAIGAALAPEQAREIEGWSVGDIGLSFVTIDASDRPILERLQIAHDNWASNVLHGRQSSPRYENKFRELIGLPPLPVEAVA